MRPIGARPLRVITQVPLAVAEHMRAAGFGHGCRRGGSSMMMFGHMRGAKAALGLSDQQAADIKRIFTDLRAQNAPYRASLRDGRQAIAQALLANPNDIAAAQALLDKQTGAERQIKANAIAAASKALIMLTPEQRSKASNFLQQRMANRADK